MSLEGVEAVNATTRAIVGALAELGRTGGKKVAGAVKLTLEGFADLAQAGAAAL